jgi:hypothetical protein
VKRPISRLNEITKEPPVLRYALGDSAFGIGYGRVTAKQEVTPFFASRARIGEERGLSETKLIRSNWLPIVPSNAEASDADSGVLEM